MSESSEKSKLFDAYAEVRLGNRVFKAPPFTVVFNLDFKAAAVPVTGNLELYNPNDETISASTVTKDKNPPVTISAGYARDFGTCFAGEIYAMELKRSGPDRVLKLKIGDKVKLWTESWVAKSYTKGKTAAYVLNDICSSKGLKIGNLDPEFSFNYTNGVTFNAPLRQVLAQVAKDTKSEIYLRSGALYVQPTAGGKRRIVLLSPDSGLLGEPEKSKTGWKVKCLFNYRLGQGDFVRVKSPVLKLDQVLKIKLGKHSYNSRAARITTFEGVAA